jgi:hypothetical protein
MQHTLNHVFRLKTYVIRHHNGNWYISEKDDPKSWGKAYDSLFRGCGAISRRASPGPSGRVLSSRPLVRMECRGVPTTLAKRCVSHPISVNHSASERHERTIHNARARPSEIRDLGSAAAAAPRSREPGPPGLGLSGFDRWRGTYDVVH